MTFLPSKNIIALISEEQKKRSRDMNLNIFNNICFSNIKLKKWADALEFSNKVLEIEEKCEKGLYRNGLCLKNLYKFDKAKISIQKCLEINPKNTGALNELKELKRIESNATGVEKKLYKKIFENYSLEEEREKLEKKKKTLRKENEKKKKKKKKMKKIGVEMKKVIIIIQRKKMNIIINLVKKMKKN